MTDRIVALFALLVLIAFLGILVVSVPEPDLMVVVVVGALLAVFDFGHALFRRAKKPPPDQH